MNASPAPTTRLATPSSQRFFLMRIHSTRSRSSRAAARDDRDLVEWIRIRKKRCDDGVASLVVGAGDAFMLAHHHRLALNAHQHLVTCRICLLYTSDAA